MLGVVGATYIFGRGIVFFGLVKLDFAWGGNGVQRLLHFSRRWKFLNRMSKEIGSLKEIELKNEITSIRFRTNWAILFRAGEDWDQEEVFFFLPKPTTVYSSGNGSGLCKPGSRCPALGGFLDRTENSVWGICKPEPVETRSFRFQSVWLVPVWFHPDSEREKKKCKKYMHI